MIRRVEVLPPTHPEEVLMLPSNVIGFTENIPVETTTQGTAFVQRMRRQLDRYGVAFPGAEGQRMAPEYETRIRSICDELEAEIREKESHR